MCNKWSKKIVQEKDKEIKRMAEEKAKREDIILGDLRRSSKPIE